MEPDDKLRRDLLRMWAEIDAVQRSMDGKIPPGIRELTANARRVISNDVLELREMAVPPTTALLCPDCANEVGLVQDDPLENPYPYCHGCGWRGHLDPRCGVGRLGVCRP